MLVGIVARIDWPRGRLGYLPRSSPRREPAVIDRPHRAGARRFIARFDVGKTWRLAIKDAAARHKNRFELFVDELVDSTVHEIAHAFEPAYTRGTAGECGAQLFAMHGRRTRR